MFLDLTLFSCIRSASDALEPSQEIVNGFGNLFDYLHKKKARLTYWQVLQRAALRDWCAACLGPTEPSPRLMPGEGEGWRGRGIEKGWLCME